MESTWMQPLDVAAIVQIELDKIIRFKQYKTDCFY